MRKCRGDRLRLRTHRIGTETLGRGNSVEPAVDRKGCTRVGNIEPNHNLGGDITPDRGPVDHVVSPDDRVDEEDEVGEEGPGDVEEGAKVAGLPVPGERERTRNMAMAQNVVKA